ncbi:MAG TPA: flavin reductase family protein [Archaeoglobaceae archaeon]|nr:flavin reductase family protein [Archaeoglobaceae archaeon]
MLEYLYPLRTYLIASGSLEKPNVMAADWVVPLSFQPALVGISIGHTRYTNKLIKEQKDFVIAVPTIELLKDVWIAGTTSGSKVNKAEKMSVTFILSKKVKAPSIKECQANIECRVVDEVEVGDHTLFVGEIVDASCGDAFITGEPDLNYSFIMHSGFGKSFTTNRSDGFIP